MNSDTQDKHGEKNTPSRRSNPVPEENENALRLNGPDWEPVLERYRQGDTSVLPLLCCKTDPLAKQVSGRRYYSASLGKEEAYSIAAMTMVDFWNRDALKCDPADIPRQLTRAINGDLLNQIKRNKNRSLREIHSGTEGTGPDSQPEFLAGSIADPEQDILQKEWNRKVRSCLKYLGKMERQVITGFFFRQMSIAEIAEELHSKPGTVSVTKRNALNKLRDVFKDKHITHPSGRQRKTTESTGETTYHDKTTLSKYL